MKVQQGEGDGPVSPADLREIGREEALERDAQLRAALDELPDQ